MNKILILSIVFLAILGFTSCSEEQIQTYKDTNNIYFSPAVYPIYTVSSPSPMLTDSTGFSFGLDNEAIKEKMYLLPMRVQGKVSDVDRKVKLTVDPSSTAVLGTHFFIPENIVMRAGREVDTIPIRVSRTADMKAKQLTVVLNLEENEFFSTKMQTKVTNVLTQKTMSFIRFKLTFDDQLVQPPRWFVPYLGVFTAKKIFLMRDLLQIQPDIFNLPADSPGVTLSDVNYYRVFMIRYLADQKASGNIIYEADGSEMYFPVF